MGTYDTRGGSPLSPEELDYLPSPLVEEVLAVLEAAQVPTHVNDRVAALIERFERTLAEDAQDALTAIRHIA